MNLYNLFLKIKLIVYIIPAVSLISLLKLFFSNETKKFRAKLTELNLVHYVFIDLATFVDEFSFYFESNSICAEKRLAAAHGRRIFNFTNKQSRRESASVLGVHTI